MVTAVHTPVFEVPVGDRDFRGDYPAVAIPQSARTSARDALLRGQTHYAPVPGIEPLRAAAVEFLFGLGVDVPIECVIVTGGEQEARFLALQGVARRYDDAAVTRGDRQARFLAVYGVAERSFRIAVPAVVHPGVQAALGVRDRPVTTMPVAEASGLLPDIAAIEEALAEGSNLIYLESPNRLTGFIYGPERVRRIAGLLKNHDALCIWDQSTAPAVAGGYVSLASVAPQHTVAIGILWPGLGLATWQIAYVVAPPTYIESLTALKQVLSICTSTPSQWAMVGAAETCAGEHDALLAEMQEERRRVLSELPGDARVLVGEAVNVLAINLGERADQARQDLLHKGIQLADGVSFGAPGLLRVTMKPGAQTADVIVTLLEGTSL